MSAAPELRVEDSVNQVCPWSGDPVSPDSLTLYRGRVVGFCNPGCRDKFARAVATFDCVIEAVEEAEAAMRPAGPLLEVQ
ncbi:MAG: hypothetical protein LDL26_09265 [Caenispirillum bisanense]|nr:hypothetical protein [Caenispirillum bisanense]MCA1973902.1 hypothetical protein [Caenispirillum sp.]